MKKLIARLGFLALILIILLIAGTLGFMVLESLPPFDAFYFTIITIATVGYGDIAPVSIGGRILSLVIIIMGVGAFTALIVNTGGLVWERRANKSRIERTNILIGLFYSIVGNELLEYCLNADPSSETIRNKMVIETNWTEKELINLRIYMQKYEFGIDIKKVDFSQLKVLLSESTNLLVSLLENPSLMEHELFTELLRATFHLREELVLRKDLTSCSNDDLTHLGNDIKRVYRMLSMVWLLHIRDLKKRYQYLFSLAIRNNPFNEKRCININ